MAHRHGHAGSGDARGPSQRQLRVGEEIRRLVARAFERGELHDPALFERSVTISEVSVSPDLRQATVWYVPLAAGADAAELQPALDRAAGYLSGAAARELRMKYAPKLRFKRDTAFDTSMRIEALLHDPRVRADVEAAARREDQREDGDDGAA